MAVSSVAYKSNISVNTISKNVSSLGKGISNAQKSANKINGILLKKTTFSRQVLANDRNMFIKRREAARRREQEDIVEASSVGGAIRRQGKVISSSTRGFLGRILDFIGTIMVGWLLNSLPTIISLAEQLITRIKKSVKVLAGFVTGISEILSGFGSLLSKTFSNLASFDFTIPKDQLEISMEQMKKGFQDIEDSIQSVIDIFSQPFDFSRPEEKQPESPSGTPGSSRTSGKLLPIHKQALDAIARPESGGNYNAMNQGTDKNGNILGSTAGGKTSKDIIGKNLTDMTIGEVMDRQNERKYPRNAVPDLGVHAAGKYQIIGKTLPSAMKLAGLKPSDPFSPENQDLMAMALLKDGGLGHWTAGGSKYTKKEVDLINKARNTPYGNPNAVTAQAPPAPGQITTAVKDEIDVSGPTGGTPSVGISDVFGYSAWRGRLHAGIDIGTSGQKGWYVSLRKSGQVVFAGSSGGYGNMVDIVGPDGTCYRFAHLARIFVKLGPYNGEAIGEIGKTGRTTGGIHLHFEVRPGGPGSAPVDPRPWLGLLAIGRQMTGAAGQPSNVSAPSITPAQISSTPGTDVSEQITTERRGAVIMMPPLFPEQPASTLSPTQQSGGGFEMPSQISDQTSLNRLILQRLLLDLAYT